jgi:hypothetical protein
MGVRAALTMTMGSDMGFLQKIQKEINFRWLKPQRKDA